jgi:hypothetical protein
MFYAAMGRAIAAWQFVEARLYEVYRALTSAQRPGADAAAFYSVGAFRAQLRFTNAAAQFALYGQAPLLKEWGTLLNRAGTKADRRNDIAHGAVWTEFQELRPDRKIHLGPNLGDTRDVLPPKQPGSDPEPITVKRLPPDAHAAVGEIELRSPPVGYANQEISHRGC